MVDENSIPHEEDQDTEQTFTPDASQHNDLSANVISESDLADDEVIHPDKFENTEQIPQIASEVIAEWERDTEPALSEAERRLEAPDPTVSTGILEADEILDRENAVTEKLPYIPSEMIEEWERDAESALEEGEKVAFEQVSDSSETDDAAPDEEDNSGVEDSMRLPAEEKPAWKVHAEKLYEERQEKQRKLLEERRQYDAQRRAEKSNYEEQLRKDKEQADAKIRESLKSHQQDRKVLMDETVERLREEKERKRKERQEVDEKIRREREERSYKNQRTTNVPEPQPPQVHQSPDIDSRITRLSKKDKEEEKSDPDIGSKK